MTTTNSRRLTANPDKGRLPAPQPLDDGDLMHRQADLAGGYDESSFEVGAVIATRTPVQRRDSKGPFLEVLDPAGLEFESGDDWPLLEDHKPGSRQMAGRVHGIEVSGDQVTGRLRLSQAEDVEPIRQRIADGSLRHVSAGYAVMQWAESRNAQGQRVKTATRWRLLEVSLVPIPADRNAIIHKRGAEMPFDHETRAGLIETLRHACSLPEEWGSDLGEEAVSDDEVRQAAREAMLTRQAPRIRVTRSHDNPAEIQTRAADALAYRMGGLAELPEASREYVHMSLMDMARDSLARQGTRTRGMSAEHSRQAHDLTAYMQAAG